MDFPINLNNKNWVYSISELQQVVEILLKNVAGSFLQDMKTGALFSLHSPTENILLDIKRTIETIPNVKVENVELVGSEIVVIMTYRGETIKYQYPLEV